MIPPGPGRDRFGNARPLDEERDTATDVDPCASDSRNFGASIRDLAALAAERSSARGPQRQTADFRDEPAPLPRAQLERQPVLLDDLPHDPQPEPAAFRTTRLRRVDREVGLARGQPRAIHLGESGTVV